MPLLTHNSRLTMGFGGHNIRPFLELDDLFDRRFRDPDDLIRRPAITGPGAPPPIVITPEIAAQDVAGGFTPNQIDIAARMETQAGAAQGIFYGKILFGATNIVSHKYESGVPRNTFTVVHGDGWGGLGRRGEWNRIVKAYYLGEELTKRFNYAVWFDDFLPAGATASNDQDGWNWISVSPTPYVGRYAHQSPNITGQHQHSFTGATTPFAILTGDTISCWVWIDPTNTPTEIMLQFFIGADQEHRAYWGANSIALGTNGTNSRRQINASIPATGQWVRLDVLASQVGLDAQSIDGMAFTLFGGSATFDQVVMWQNTMSGNTGYIFRPGIIPPDSNDIIQFQDITTWPSGLPYPGSAATTVRLNTTQSAQDRPDGFKAIIECRKLRNYDNSGAEIITDYGYSANPARVAADRILHFFERRYRNNPDFAQQQFRNRVYWPSWVAWRDYCDQLIPWDREGDGVNVLIPRFEFHGGFITDISLAGALDQITGMSATIWQDDGRQLIFLPPSPRDPIHHFNPSNIVDNGAPQISLIDLRKRPNRFIARFRDSDDEFLGLSATEPPDNTAEAVLRQESIIRVGEMRSEREFTNMTQSQARRILEYRARLEHDNPIRCTLVGNAMAFHVLKGDFVTVTHPVPGWDHQLCLVLGITIKSAEDSADEIICRLQRIDGRLYDDLAHRPRQVPLTL